MCAVAVGRSRNPNLANGLILTLTREPTLLGSDFLRPPHNGVVFGCGVERKARLCSVLPGIGRKLLLQSAFC